MHVLLIKMSSLGDLVHTLPAVDDAVRQGVRFDWLAEEDFMPIAALHPGVEAVVPVAFRRWRSAPLTSLGELRAFRKRLRSRRYDLVLDAQGLLKSAIVGGWARADDFVGFDRTSARERIASLRYKRRIEVDKSIHAVDRLRRLFAEAIGYQLPSRKADFGIDLPSTDNGQPSGAASSQAPRRCVLLHGTTWQTKHWPESFWIELAQRVADMGLIPTLLWGNPQEHQRAVRIADAAPGTEVLGEMRLDAVLVVLAAAFAVVGVDSGLAHLAAALGRPTVVVFGPTDARLTGCRGANVANLQSRLACSPCLSDQCRYRGAPLQWRDVDVRPACYANVDPERVAAALASRVRVTA